MRLSLPATLTLAAVAMTNPVDARYYSGGLLVPRRSAGSRNYLYNRPPSVTRNTDAFDMAFDFFRTPIYDAANSLLRQSEAALEHLASPSYNPRYAVTQNQETGTMELSMEVPGMAAKDLVVEVEDDSMLRVQGTRIVNYQGDSVQTEFDRSFRLDEDIDVSSLKVTLSSGILKITGHKKEKVIKRLDIATGSVEEEEQEIPLSQKQDSASEEATIPVDESDKTESNPAEETPDGLTITEDET